MVQQPATTSNVLVEEQLHEYARGLQDVLNADVLSFVGPITYGADDLIRDIIESRQKRRRRVAFLLETPGGYIEVAERIANTLRHHYREVEFIIPNFAMSAGTVLAMSGDAIHMNYYSVLGPIDPQVARPNSTDLIPALGYLAKFEELIEKSRRGELTTAELAYLVQKFDPAEMYSFEQASQLSITLLKQWLVKYKFRNWKVTKGRKIKVTRKMKIQRAAEIAEKLNDIERWRSHSRGISMQVLKRTLKLQIDDFGRNKQLNHQVQLYYKLLKDYMMRVRLQFVLHREGSFVPRPGN